MKIAIGADHRGFSGKEYLKQHVVMKDNPIIWLDVGTFQSDRVDYPIFAQQVCEAILSKKVDCGVLLCGTGIGMAIVANRFPKIYAGVAWNEEVAGASKRADNSNVLVIPSDFVSLEESVAIVHAWLTAIFQGGRYQQRIGMIDRLNPHHP